MKELDSDGFESSQDLHIVNDAKAFRKIWSKDEAKLGCGISC